MAQQSLCKTGHPRCSGAIFIGWGEKRGVIVSLSSHTLSSTKAGSRHPDCVLGSVVGDLAVSCGGLCGGAYR